MDERRFTYTKLLDNPTLPVTPIRLINTIRRRELVLDALWDTGAQTSVISHRASLTLDLPRLRKPPKNLRSMGGTTPSRAVLSIAMPGDANWAAIVEVDEVEQIPTDFDFVIGMDIITRGDFAIAMEGGRTRLSFTFGKDFFYLPVGEQGGFSPKK